MKDQEGWTSRRMFFVASIGAIAGVGNLWFFPSGPSQYGGPAFFVAFLVAVLFAAIPLILLEYAAGTYFRKTLPGSLKEMAPSLRWAGWLAVSLCLLTAFILIPVLGWTIAYTGKSTQYTWNEPIYRGTVFLVPVTSYDSSDRREPIGEKGSARKGIETRLYRDGNLEGLKKRLLRHWPGRSREEGDIQFWTLLEPTGADAETKETVRTFIRTVFEERTGREPADTVRILLTRPEFLKQKDPERNVIELRDRYYQDRMEMLRYLHDPWRIQHDPDRTVEFRTLSEQVENHWYANTLRYLPDQWRDNRLLNELTRRLNRENFRLDRLEDRQFIYRIQIDPEASTNHYIDAKRYDVTIDPTLFERIRNRPPGEWRPEVDGLLERLGTDLRRFTELPEEEDPDEEEDPHITEAGRESLVSFLEETRETGIARIHFLERLSPRTAGFVGRMQRLETQIDTTSDENQSRLRRQHASVQMTLLQHVRNILENRRTYSGPGPDQSNDLLLGIAVFLWGLVTVFLLKGIPALEKLMVWTVPLPILFLLILFVMVLFQEGSISGMGQHLVAEWDQLTRIPLWREAFEHVIFTSMLGFGMFLTFARFRPEERGVQLDGLGTALGGTAITFFLGFFVFSVLGALSYLTLQPVEAYASAGPDLAFISFPVLFPNLPLGRVLGILFFLSIFMLGFDTVIAFLEVAVSSLLEGLDTDRRTPLVFFLIFAGVTTTCFFTMSSGLLWITIIEEFILRAFGLPLVLLVFCLAVILTGHSGKLRSHLHSDNGLPLAGWWEVSLLFFVPAGSLFVLRTSIHRHANADMYGFHRIIEGSVFYAGWGCFLLLLLIAALPGPFRGGFTGILTTILVSIAAILGGLTVPVALLIGVSAGLAAGGGKVLVSS